MKESQNVDDSDFLRTFVKYDMKYDKDEIIEKNERKKEKFKKPSDKIKIDSCNYCFDSSNPFIVYESDNLYLSIPQRTQMLGSAHLTILPKTHFDSFLHMDEEILQEIRLIQKRVKKLFI